MPPAPIPADEEARIEALEAYHILDTLPEQVFDDITFLASMVCDTPIALISLVDRERQWFKSRVGLDLVQTPRDLAFCAHAIVQPDDLFVVDDAVADARFMDNSLVDELGFRFYAAAPLRATEGGSAIGTLCIIDRRPRELTNDQRDALVALSRQVIGQLELRKALRDLGQHQDRLERYQRDLERANEILKGERSTDGLTGVANRRAFDLRLGEEIHRAVRYGHPLGVVICDVDRFKDYNDDHGHAAGDEVLKTVARLLEEAGRSSDSLARLGGDEFAATLPDTGSEGVMVVAERLRRAVEAYPWEHTPVTISVGAAGLRLQSDSAKALLSRADSALYEAKKRGRNRVAAASDRQDEPRVATSGPSARG